MPPAIATTRLGLEALDSTCLNDVHALFSAPGHTIGDGPVADAGETLAWLRRRQGVYAELGWAWYGLWLSNQFVGTCGLFQSGRCGSDPEIGYEIAASMRGLGYAKEAAEAVTAAAGLADVRHVWATIRPANTASLRIVQALGYEYVRTDADAKGELAYYRTAVPTS